jgi:uncharacterized membrane protein
MNQGIELGGSDWWVLVICFAVFMWIIVNMIDEG